MKENIEEDIKIVEKLIKTMEQDRITFKDEQTKEIYAYFITALEHILSDYKRIQEEFKQVDHECERLEQKELRLEKEVEIAKEALKKQCDIADKRNQLLKENEELKAENNKLKVIKYDTNYGTETTNLIPKSELVKINTNRCMIEIENGKFVDLKQVYQENEELKYKYDKALSDLVNTEKGTISKQKIKDKIEYIEKEGYWLFLTDRDSDKCVEVLKDLLEEKGE